MIETQKAGDRVRKGFFIRDVTSLSRMNVELGFGTWFCKLYTKEYLNIYWGINYTDKQSYIKIISSFI